jgi:prepilin-type N-terminal cleavage/methylation domain-containing protein
MNQKFATRQHVRRQSSQLYWRFWHSAVSAAPGLFQRIIYTLQSALRRFLALYPNAKFWNSSQRVVRRQEGFTLPELISVMAVSGLFVGLILYFGISYWRYSALLENDLDTFVSRLNAQDVVRELVGTTTGLISQNSIPDANANNPDPLTGATYWIPIHAVPGNTAIGASGTTTPLLYFRRISVDSSNAVALNGTQPYEDEYVLYLNGTTKQMLLRTLANPNVPNDKVRTSCPPANASTSCPADRVIIDNLGSVDAIYYSRSGNTINYQSSTDSGTGQYNGPDFPLVEALQYNFHITKKSLFVQSNGTINDTIVRIALRNT